MNKIGFLLLCVQACFVQNVFGQCLGNYGAAGVLPPYGPIPGAAPFGYPGYAEYGYPVAEWAAPCLDAYGGAGEGNVAVIGDLPVAGSSIVNGQVPIMGAVNFAGPIPAAGYISITGNCACGCGVGGPYIY